MKYTVGELIDLLSRFDKDLEIDNNISVTWHHSAINDVEYTDFRELDDVFFDSCDKIWIFEDASFENFLKWHGAIMEDIDNE